MTPGQTLALPRITFAPGGCGASHTRPGETLFHLAAGTLRFTLHDGEARLVRAVAVGEEITLSAGDTIYYDAAVPQSERNAGDEDAVVIVANLRGVDEPARQFHDPMAAGTPVA